MKITSKSQLIQYIIDCKDARKDTMVLWVAYGHTKSVSKEVYELDMIHIGSPIHDNSTILNNEFLYHKTGHGFDYNSLSDRNLGNHSYNDNWWFTTEESARDFVNPVETIKFNKNDIPEWMSLLLKGQKINAIKAIRAEMQCDLITSKRFLEAFENSMRIG